MRCIRHILFVLVTTTLTVVADTHFKLLSIDCEKHYQQIEGFGASDAWNCESIGKYWSQEQKEQATTWLFSSTKDKEGKPEGASLSIWRVNLGAGSAEQGRASEIKDSTRRASSFLDSDGVIWNPTRLEGQKWFIREAMSHGVNQFVAFSVSPHVSQTINGLAHASKSARSNIVTENYEAFSDYLIRSMGELQRQTGVFFEYLSPLNEPQYSWDTDKQEGCSYTNEQIASFVKILDQRIVQSGINTKLLIPEAADWRALTQQTNEPAYSNQIVAFWNQASPLFIGDLQTVAPAVAGHSYWLNRTPEEMREVRTEVATVAKLHRLDVKQTEYSMINLQEIEGNRPTSRWDIALFLGRVIQADLVYGYAKSWSFWTALEQDVWGYKNRYQLIRIEAEDPTDLSKGGVLIPEKNLWIMAHYSSFIRPGFQRVHLDGADGMDGLFASSYLSEDRQELVTVLLNDSNKDYSIQIRQNQEFRETPSGERTWTLFSTTEHQTMRKKTIVNPKLDSIRIPSKSIHTLVIN